MSDKIRCTVLPSFDTIIYSIDEKNKDVWKAPRVLNIMAPQGQESPQGHVQFVSFLGPFCPNDSMKALGDYHCLTHYTPDQRLIDMYLEYEAYLRTIKSGLIVPNTGGNLKIVKP